MTISVLKSGFWRRARITGAVGVVAAVALTLAASIAPQSVYPTPLPGNDYLELGKRALPVENDGKIHVAEIFWYGCHYCQEFEPAFRAWIKSQGDRVSIDRVPAAVEGLLVPGAKAFYAMEDLGLLTTFHDELLVAAQAKVVDTTDDKAILDWFAKQGVDRQLFGAAYDSTRVAQQVEEARKLVTSLAIDTIPSIIVNGSYLTSTQMAGGYQKEIDVLDYLATLPATPPRTQSAGSTAAAGAAAAANAPSAAGASATDGGCGCSAR